MTKNNQHKETFSASGCIEYASLLSHINNRLSEKEARLVEQHLESCPLCSDALEGLKNAHHPEMLPHTFNRINENLLSKINKKQQLKINRDMRNFTPKRMLLYVAAASIVLLIGIFGTLHYQQKNKAIKLSQARDSFNALEKDNELLAYNHVTPEMRKTLMARSSMRVEAKKESSPKSLKPLAEELELADDEIRLKELEMHDNPEFEFQPLDETIMESKEPVFSVVEIMPSFQNGDTYRFREYIAKNLQYPDIAIEKGIGGKVLVQFVVNQKGKIDQATVVKRCDPLLDKEALRVIKNSPPWKPGMQRGKTVSVQFTIPIEFILK